MSLLYAPELLDALEGSVLSEPLECECWRETIGKRDPLSPNSRGARWNPPGIDTLYCALTSDGAIKEVTALLAKEPVLTSLPRRLAHIVAHIERVADLRGDVLRAPVGLAETELLSEDWTVTQGVGAASAWLGLGALIVPSARHRTGNLVVFVNNLQADDTVRVVDTENHSS